MPADLLDEQTITQWEDRKLTTEEAEELLDVLCDPLADLLGLEDWALTVGFDDLTNRHDGGGWAASGIFKAQWSYRTASITIDIAAFPTLEDFVETLLHEHLHLVLAPMEKLGELEAEMYEVDPRSEKFIVKSASHFREMQVDELRRLLGGRMRTVFGISVLDWLMTLAIRHLEERDGNTDPTETPDSGERAPNSQRAGSGAALAGAAARANQSNQGRHLHPGAGAGPAAARYRTRRR